MFRYKLFLLLTIGMVQVWGQSIVIPQQQVQWRNIMGNNYSPFDKQEFYYKAMIEVNVPSSLIGDYFIGFELPGNDIKRRLTNSSNESLTYFLTAKTLVKNLAENLSKNCPLIPGWSY